MATTIKCNKCHNQIEITEAIREELQAKVLQEAESKHQLELKKIEDKHNSRLKELENEMDESKKKITEAARKEAIDKIRKEYDAKIEVTKEESREKEKQNTELQSEIKELFKQIRNMKDEKDKQEIEYEKKLLFEQDKMKRQAKNEAQEEYSLKIAERDKRLDDASKQIKDLQRKLEQGSQQLQGEVLELDLEQTLKNHFPHDIIEPVKKGVKGADVRHTVRSPKGFDAGVILWEAKRAKAWQNVWIEKLKDDLRGEKANIPVIISTVLPGEIEKELGHINGVWISSHSLAIPLAMLLRQNLLDVYRQRVFNERKGDKAEHLYEYITSHKFRQQVEAMLDVYFQMKQQITKERTSYEKMWAAREKQVDQLFRSTANIVGDIQGEVGFTALQIKGLELSDLEHDEI